MTYGAYCKAGAPDALGALIRRLSARRVWKMKHRMDRMIRRALEGRR